jgi:hypothetical protein
MFVSFPTSLDYLRASRALKFLGSHSRPVMSCGILGRKRLGPGFEPLPAPPSTELQFVERKESPSAVRPQLRWCGSRYFVSVPAVAMLRRGVTSSTCATWACPQFAGDRRTSAAFWLASPASVRLCRPAHPPLGGAQDGGIFWFLDDTTMRDKGYEADRVHHRPLVIGPAPVRSALQGR